MLMTIIIFIIVLSILVFAHESGHYFTARLFGIKPKEFGFGFPPRAWGIYKDTAGKWKQVWGSKDVSDADDTIYSLNWIPIGGFVNIGEDDPNETGPDSFHGKKIWQRAIILSSGVIMNVILAAVILSLGFMFGIPQLMGSASDPSAVVLERNIQIIEVLPDSPADKAGLMVNDIILDIDGNKFASIDELQKYVENRTGQELTYDIKRENIEFEKRIDPLVIQETQKGGVGIAIAGLEIVKYPWYIAVWKGFKSAILLCWAIILAFIELFRNLFAGLGVPESIAGPVGIAKLTGKFSRMGLAYLTQFTAVLSLNLAILNFIPIPALDGGRVLFLFIEKFRGKPIKREVEAIIHNLFFTLLMILVLLITLRDIANLSIIKKFFGG